MQSRNDSTVPDGVTQCASPAIDRRVSTPGPVAETPARTGYFLDEKETSRYD
ncbi:MAG: hypothetical protein H8K10_01700 [Nitrospira sp.]|nr:hypothetical protein [Nitrospira sp.]